MKGILLAISMLFSLGAIAQSDDEIMIKSIMQDQEIAWNKGDLDAFMLGYWKSDSLMFVGSKGPTCGWQQTLDNYKKGYPNPQAMGQLQFTNLELLPLEKDHYLVVGKWHLERTDIENLEGHYSLVWRRINGRWVIIADHSS
jgi:ketosteroid isomerase-like protein